MKRLFALPLLMGIIIPSTALYAQPKEGGMPKDAPGHEMMRGRMMPPPPIPGLTEEQDARIKKINMETEKANLPLDNNIKELEAKLRTATTGDNVSLEAANKLIDEISAVKTKIIKNNTRAHLEIRSLLNDEQKLFWDKQPPMERPRMPRPPKKEIDKD